MADKIEPVSISAEIAQIETEIAGEKSPAIESAVAPAPIVEADNKPAEADEPPAPTEAPPAPTEVPKPTEAPAPTEEPVENPVDEEVEFDFRKTPTSIENLVTKVGKMTEAERLEKIESLDPSRSKAELAALEKAYPESFTKPETVTMEHVKELQAKLASLEKLENLSTTQDLLDRATQQVPVLEEQLRNRMLKDQFGDRFNEVTQDEKFIANFEKYSDLPIEDRLEIACTMSPVARALANAKTQKAVDLTRVARNPKAGPAPVAPAKERTAKEMVSPQGIRDELAEIQASMDK